jgi:hypothetical protein
MNDNNENMVSLIESRNKVTARIISIFKKYLYKFIISTFNNINIENTQKLLEFQKILYKIPSWAPKKINKEYNLFIKYIYKKYNLTEDKLIELFQHMFILKIKTISNTFYDSQVPVLKEFLYVTLKYVSKYFYEHPHDMRNINDLEINHLIVIENILNTLINKQIPLSKILVENNNNNKLKYNFSKYKPKDDSITSNDNNIIKNESTHSENSLIYISSEQFENEYYKPTQDLIHNDTKEIDIPRYLIDKKANKNNDYEIQEI